MAQRFKLRLAHHLTKPVFGAWLAMTSLAGCGLFLPPATTVDSGGSTDAVISDSDQDGGQDASGQAGLDGAGLDDGSAIAGDGAPGGDGDQLANSQDATSQNAGSQDVGSQDGAGTTGADGGDGGADVPPGPLCPTAKITGATTLTLIPQTTVQLSGEKSSTFDGKPVAAYQWTVTLPAGTSQGLIPTATSPNVSLPMMIAGSYTICLSVIDQAGNTSCKPDCLVFMVIPDSSLHIELTWTTPADPNPNDIGPGAGSDLDLHFAHDLANTADLDCDGEPDPWFSNPFDAFWFNPAPAWGDTDPAVLDDPTLDLDDTDGAGPENLNLDAPEGSVASPRAYQVGVMYWNDHGFGDSYATVRIYIEGILMTVTPPQKLAPLDMWHVGRVTWPNQVSTPQSTLPPVTLCYQSGDLCATTNPGTKWTTTGMPCVTPCYINAAFVPTTSAASNACK